MSDIYARSVQRYLLETIAFARRRGTDGDKATAVTGEAFVDFAGESCNTIGEARDAFLAKWKEYLKGKTNHVLYIRSAPTVTFHSEDAKWVITARLLLSDKEVKK